MIVLIFTEPLENKSIFNYEYHISSYVIFLRRNKNEMRKISLPRNYNGKNFQFGVKSVFGVSTLCYCDTLVS